MFQLSEYEEARRQRNADFRRFCQNEDDIIRAEQVKVDGEEARLARLAKFAAEIAKLEGK
jgi:hypothetical protein